MLANSLLAALCATAALGQTPVLEWTPRVHPAFDPQNPEVWNRHNVEAALRVNRLGTEVTIAWMHFYLRSGLDFDLDTYYNVSLEGGPFNQTFATVLPTIPPPPYPQYGWMYAGAGDPMVAYSNNSDCAGCGAWIGGLMSTGAGFWVAKKEPGQQFVTTTAVPVRYEQWPANPAPLAKDKGWLVAGPAFGGGAETVGLVYGQSYNAQVNQHDEEHKFLRRVASTDLGVSWPSVSLPVGAELTVVTGNPIPQQIGNRGATQDP